MRKNLNRIIAKEGDVTLTLKEQYEIKLSDVQTPVVDSTNVISYVAKCLGLQIIIFNDKNNESEIYIQRGEINQDLKTIYIYKVSINDYFHYESLLIYDPIIKKYMF